MSQQLSLANKSELKNIKGVCLDIDDTLSTHGKLTASAFQSLWDLKNAGFRVIPITGRPAGWCDHIARFWPVDAVVGENGAFTLYMDGKKLKRITTPGASLDPKKEIRELGIKIKKRFQFAEWASDQAYREYDLAIDFCEDVKPWKESDIKDLVTFCEDQGAHAKVSSIHVNTWFGDYDKNKGFKNWLLHSKQDEAIEWLFIGDSPNDEPMFKEFKNSVGVANIGKFISSLKYPPRWITDAASGDGFSEMVQKLINSP